MKKIIKIAKYDFKRLLLNPITVIGFAIIVVISLIAGITYKIPTAPAYSISISGQTAKEVYSDFTNPTNTLRDSKMKLDNYLLQAENYLTIQSSANYEYLDFKQIVLDLGSSSEMVAEIEKFNATQENSCKYLTDSNFNQLRTLSSNLKTFIEDYKSKNQFETRLLFETKQVQQISDLSTYFSNQVYSTLSTKTVLRNLYSKLDDFKNLDTIYTKAYQLTIDSTQLNELEASYITKAQTKTERIFAELETFKNSTKSEDLEKAISLIKEYKLTCESAKTGILDELKLCIYNFPVNYKKLYNYSEFSLEDTKLEIILANQNLDSEDLYFTQYQEALNFGSASYKVTAYDHAYMITSIAGFILIIVGIFFTYKLFGRDKKNGKLDLLLSQKVKFGEVFTGKFVALIFSTTFLLLMFMSMSLLWGYLFYGTLPGEILAVFNLTNTYTISPFMFFLIKAAGIELQVIFYSVITLFIMNITRKFEAGFIIALLIFAITTITNILLNGQLWYCLLPFIHCDITSFVGGATMQSGFLKTSLYAYGNFYISVIYYLIFIGLLYNFTKQLFKKN